MFLAIKDDGKANGIISAFFTFFVYVVDFFNRLLKKADKSQDQ